ncbi:MAG: sensor histidine kinase, partial [Segetibacter sp.]
IITFNDITQLKKAQLDVDRKNKSLERINADLDNFVLSASHDLLGPLSNIEVTIALVNQLNINEPELVEYFDIINGSVKKFRIMLKELSAIGKVESEAYKVEAVNVKKLIDEVTASISDKISSTKTVITTELQIEEVFFSKKNLRSILYNLISNALKFKSNGQPEIQIIARHEGEFVRLSVRDNGIGMSARDIQRVFGIYNRLDQTTEGQGVGLYLVKKLVDATGGKVEVESEPGKGSIFTIFLKAEEPAIV